MRFTCSFFRRCSACCLPVVHVALFRKHGVTPAVNADEKKIDAFYPRQAFKDIRSLGCCVLVVIFLFVRCRKSRLADLCAGRSRERLSGTTRNGISAALFRLRLIFHWKPTEIVGTTWCFRESHRALLDRAAAARQKTVACAAPAFAAPHAVAVSRMHRRRCAHALFAAPRRE